MQGAIFFKNLFSVSNFQLMARLSSKYFSTTRDSITNYAVTYMTSGKLSDLDVQKRTPQGVLTPIKS